MFQITKQAGKEHYAVMEFMMDSKADLQTLPDCAQGSVAFAIDTSQVFMKKSDNSWKEV